MREEKKMVASSTVTFSILTCVCYIVFAEEHHLDVDASVTQRTESAKAHKFTDPTPSDHSASLNVKSSDRSGSGEAISWELDRTKQHKE